MAAAFAGPDAEPVLGAVRSCDRSAMATLTRAEPHRRSEWAAASYAEQQAIASSRSALLTKPGGEATPAGQATINLALSQLDARQKQLDDARAVEASWRALVDELRADFLANCAQGKRNADN